MKNKLSSAEIMKNVQLSSFVHNCAMPIGYKPGLPILKTVNSGLYLVIPFLKYKITGEVDKTQVFPIKYTVTVSLPDKNIVGFDNLKTNNKLSNIDFENPVGLFRHDSVKQFAKAEYEAKRNELLGMYDKIINALLYNEKYTQKDDADFKELLNIILEPSLKPFYSAIDSDFYNKYII